MMTYIRELMFKVSRCAPGFVFGVLCGVSCVFTANAQTETADPDAFGGAMKAFVEAQQDALNSGDPDRILNSSTAVAATSLALLHNLDDKDQDDRNALEALSYTNGLLNDASTELTLLSMELSLGEKDEALELKKHIVDTNEKNAKLDLAIAEVLERGMAFGEAIPEAQNAVDLEPSSRDAHIALGMGYWGLNAFQYNDDTLQEFTAARQADPDGYAPNILLGRIESQYQHFDLADAYLRTAAAANPSAPEPWYHLGINAYERSHPADAVDLLKHFLALAGEAKNTDPAQVRRALLTLDEAEEQQGKPVDQNRREQEDELKRQILEAHAGANGASDRDTLPMGVPDTRDEHRFQSQSAQSSTPETLAQVRALAANALANIGTVLARKQEYAAAVVPLKFAAAQDPSSESLMRNLGLASCISGLYEEGVDALRRFASIHPEDTTAVGCLGMSEFGVGNYADASKAFASLGPTVSSEPSFGATAAAAFARTGDPKRAQETLAKVSNVDQNPQLQARLAMAYLDVGDVDHALELANAVNGGPHSTGEAYRVLGIAHLERGELSKAVADFEEECEADRTGSRDHLEAEALLAEALLQTGKRTESQNWRSKVVAAKPEFAKELIRESELLIRNGDRHTGFEKAAAALGLAPHDKAAQNAFDSAKQALHNSVK